MIIDSKQYNGVCECGASHEMTTERCIIESGALKRFDGYLGECGISGVGVAVFDTNTYAAVADRIPNTEYKIILPADGLHADNHGVDLLMAELPESFDYLVAVGAGSIHDMTRYTAYTKSVPFISCPTAASVDGFCSSVAAMTWHGFKKTLTAVAPRLVIADLDVISAAPMYLTKSGFCDLIGKFISLTDWRVGNILTGEKLCPRIYKITMDATVAVVALAEDIKNRVPDACGKLIYGLLMSGLAMQLLGNSRCASGAEHHISHIIEMQPEGLSVSSSALHGEKVGVGTLIAAREYHRLASSHLEWCDYEAAAPEYIRGMFGDLTDSIIDENKNDVCCGITAEQIKAKWGEICEIVRDVPTYEELLSVYRTIGAYSTLEDIGVPGDRLEKLIEYSPLVRNRLTLMRLRRASKRGIQ